MGFISLNSAYILIGSIWIIPTIGMNTRSPAMENYWASLLDMNGYYWIWMENYWISLLENYWNATPARESGLTDTMGFSDSMGTAGLNWDLARLRSGSAPWTECQNRRQIDCQSICQYMPESMSDYILYICIYIYLFISDIYFQMICQKLCLNNVSRWGTLEESNFVCGSSSKSKLFEPEICLGSFYHLHYEKCHFGR